MIKQIETPDEGPTDAAPDGLSDAPMPSTPPTPSTSPNLDIGDVLKRLVEKERP